MQKPSLAVSIVHQNLLQFSTDLNYNAILLAIQRVGLAVILAEHSFHLKTPIFQLLDSCFGPSPVNGKLYPLFQDHGGKTK